MDDFEALLAGSGERVADVARRAREVIRSVLPGTVEQVDAPAKLLGFGGDRTYRRLICAVAPQRSYVNLMFSRGVDLPDPDGLLVGTGKKARHVRLRTVADVEQPAVLALLEAAGPLTQ